MHRSVVIFHILTASFALLALLVPLFGQKGGRHHRRFGWVFVGAMVVAAFSGIALSLRHRVEGLFLAMIGTMTLSSLWLGVRAVRRRKGSMLRHPLDVVLPLAVLSQSAVVGVFGYQRGSFLFGAFAVLAGFVAIDNLRLGRRGPEHWREVHASGMLGAVVSAITAFSVAGTGRLLHLPNGLAWLPWLVPPLVMVPIFRWLIARERRAFSAGAA